MRLTQDDLIFSCEVQPAGWEGYRARPASGGGHDVGLLVDNQEFFVVDKFRPDRFEVVL